MATIKGLLKLQDFKMSTAFYLIGQMTKGIASLALVPWGSTHHGKL